MALFRRLFYRKPPDRLLEISERVYVVATLLNFVRMFRKAHEENCKQAELERKKAQKEAEMEKEKGVNLTKRTGK